MTQIQKQLHNLKLFLKKKKKKNYKFFIFFFQIQKSHFHRFYLNFVMNFQKVLLKN